MISKVLQAAINTAIYVWLPRQFPWWEKLVECSVCHFIFTPWT